MTREEQIEHQASEYANVPDNTIEWGDGWIDFDQVFDAFKNGAEWADAHPQFSREEFIEKAAEWIGDNVYLYVSDLSGTVFEQQLKEAFIAAMEE